MINYENKEYYSPEEGCQILKINSPSSLIKKIKRDFNDKYIFIDGEIYISRSFIDGILERRNASVNFKEASKLLNLSLDSTRAVIKRGMLESYVDSWDGKHKIYLGDIEKLTDFSEYFSVTELSDIFRITPNNIRKKIMGNYCDINSYKKLATNGGIFIKKDFLKRLEEIDKVTMPINEVASKLAIREKDIINVCKREDIKYEIDFNTGKQRIYIEDLERICEEYNSNELNHLESYIKVDYLCSEVAMTEDKLRKFYSQQFKDDINNHITDIKDDIFIGKSIQEEIILRLLNLYEKGEKINLYEQEDEVFNLKEMSTILNCAVVTVARKCRSNKCNMKAFRIIKGNSFYIKSTFLDFIREIRYTSITIPSQSKIALKLMKEYKELENILFFCDLVSNAIMIKKNELEALDIKLNGELSNYISRMNNVSKHIKKEKSVEIPKNYIGCRNVAVQLDISYRQMEYLLKKFNDIAEVYNNKKYIKEENIEVLADYIKSKQYIFPSYRKKINYKKEYIEENKKENYIEFNLLQKELSMGYKKIAFIMSNYYKVHLNELIKFYGQKPVVTKRDYDYLRNSIFMYFENNYIKIFKLSKYSLLKEKIILDVISVNNKLLSNDDVKIIYDYKAIHSNSIDKVVIEVDKRYKQYVCDKENEYDNKINIRFVLEKYSVNIRELKDFLMKGFNVTLESEFIRSKGAIFLSKAFVNEKIAMIEEFDIRELKKMNDFISYKQVCQNIESRSNELIKTVKENLNINLEEELYYVFGKRYLNKFLYEKIKAQLHELYMLKQLDIDLKRVEQYKNIEELKEIFNVSVNTLKKVVKLNSCVCIVDQGGYYMPITLVNEISNTLDNTKSFQQVFEEYNITRNVLTKICNKFNYKIIKNPFNITENRISIEDLNKIIQSDEMDRIHQYKNIIFAEKNSTNEIEYFNILVEKIEVKKSMKKTLDIFKNFSIERISNTNGKYSRKYTVAKNCIRVFYYINRNLTKDIFLCNNDEIIKLFENSDNSTYYKILKSFVQYCKIVIDCRYDANFSYSQIKKSNDTTEYDIYSKDEWSEITKFLTDIDLHILKAFNDQKYACIWLLSLLHLVSTWRINDMVTKLPNTDLELVDIYDFGWFKDGNEFKLSMAQSIFKNLELRLEGALADKNGEPLRLFYSIDLCVPIAISYIICEIHRRKNKQIKIFSVLISEKYENEIGAWVMQNGIGAFFKRCSVKRFSNLKATRTLLSYMFEVANEIEGSNSISYMMCGAMRSHKIGQDILLPRSTQIYLKPIVEQEDIRAVSFNLIKRGFFGWIPYKLLKFIYNEEKKFEHLEINQITDNIVDIRKNGLIGLENISKCINDEIYNGKYLNMINELISLDKSELKKRVINILTYESASKHKAGGCLKGVLCAFPNRKDCIACEYFVPNIYFLYYVNEEILKVLEKLRDIDEKNVMSIEKYKKILFDLLSIINEAKLFYHDYDDNFVDQFIDIRSIKDNMKVIGNKIFIGN